MSLWSLTDQQSVFKRYHSKKHLWEFYPQNGGEITLLSPYVYISCVLVIDMINAIKLKTKRYYLITPFLFSFSSSQKEPQISPLFAIWRICQNMLLGYSRLQTWLLSLVYLSAITVTNISQSFTNTMAARTSWYRCGTKLRCYHQRNK